MAYSNIKDPSEHFQAHTYTGTAGIHDVALGGNSDMQPDLVWFKNRTVGYSHQLYDSTRGTTKALFPDGVNAETTVSNGLTQFQSDGFRVTSAAAVNENAMVCWNWKANGGTTTSFSESGNNPGGTRQTNSTAGFSIISYTGTGGPGNIAHGLPSAPEWIIFKNRGTTNVWAAWHQALGDDLKIVLNGNDAKDADGSFMNSTLPDATNIRVGDSNNPNTNADAGTYICYAWSPIQGYSKFGSYTGNGSGTDGPFVYTGFAPAWVMIRNADNVNGRNWYIYDSKRKSVNPNGTVIRADTDGAEITDQAIDVLSNGFKVRPSSIGSYGTSNINHSGQKILYMAFAENPFVAGGVPTTAR